MALFNEKQINDEQHDNKLAKKPKGIKKENVVKFTGFNEEEFDKKKVAAPKKKKEKKPQIKASIADIVPITDMTAKGLIELRDKKGYFDIWQLDSKDIYSMNAEEANFDIYNLAYFYQAFHDSVKVISMNFPVSTVQQQLFIEKKINECQNPLYKKFLNQKLQELQFLEWGRTNREYYIFVYGDTELKVTDRVKAVQNYLQKSLPLLEVSKEKKIDVLFKLYNQNTKLGHKKFN